MEKIIFSEDQIQDIIEMYKDNAVITIANKYNCTCKVITRILKEQNIELRGNRKYFFNENIFDNIDTAEKAYWLGFILADGYLNEKRGVLTIKLQYTDKEHLEKFAKFINYPKEKIRTEKHNITGKPLCCITLNSRKITNSLLKLNIRQGKSTKEQIAPIPDNFARDYIRGIIDGDGNICKKNINICNSIEVLNYIKQYLNNTCYTTIGKICEHSNTYRIYICKNRDIVLNHLYYNDCVCLDRKYNFIKENYKCCRV